MSIVIQKGVIFITPVKQVSKVHRCICCYTTLHMAWLGLHTTGSRVHASRRSSSVGESSRGYRSQQRRHHSPSDRPDQSSVMVSCSPNDEEKGICTSGYLISTTPSTFS